MKKKIYNRPVSVTLSECMFRQIHEIAEKEEMSMSEIIRSAVEEKLSKNNKATLHHCRKTN